MLSLFSRPVVSDSSWPHGLQHGRPPCPLPPPRVCPSSCPLHWWCHPAISLSLSLLLPLIFPSIRIFSNESAVRNQHSWLFPMLAVTKVLELQLQCLPMSIQGWFPLRLTSLISLLFKGLSKVSSASLKASILLGSAFFMVHFSQVYMTTEKTIALTIWTFAGKAMSLLFYTLSRFVIDFHCLLISWLQSPSAVILEPKKRKSVTASTITFCLPWSDGTSCHDLSFFNI